ncbi:hypothetical protein [Liquorilactobacillus uvarum]|uniref:Uncharacterized protein n=1 Tax=Liquorilactobacillus uvarum DSM 19971 TaxID=1423812 RepID=A0A0R1PWS4_9LACO|nr:hypothetical protein [Liquorilactobacillus uvarum]KRL33059.1 hypothetical protein FD20_GL002034 [Liquorilactobacillus uvarum DSM 19971]
MARYGKKDGFNVENIVKVNDAKKVDNDTINDNANVKTNDNSDVIEKLKGETHEKERLFVYLDKDIAYKVKSYGKQIGKWRGGNSKIVSEALKLYFKKYNL